MNQKMDKLFNDFYLCEEYLEGKKDIFNVSSIDKYSLFKLKRMIKKEGFFVPFIDVKEIKDVRAFLKKLVIVYKHCLKNNIKIADAENVMAYIKNKEESTLDVYEKVYKVLEVVSINDLKKIYIDVYDKACEYLDNEFVKSNFCDFRDDSCACQRSGLRVNKTKDGCCSNVFYYRKIDHMPVYTGRCEQLKNGGGCKIKCISCKLFTCKYLKMVNIKYECKDIFLLDIFWNKKQQKFANTSYFKTQEEIIENLMKLD